MADIMSEPVSTRIHGDHQRRQSLQSSSHERDKRASHTDGPKSAAELSQSQRSQTSKGN